VEVKIEPVKISYIRRSCGAAVQGISIEGNGLQYIMLVHYALDWKDHSSVMKALSTNERVMALINNAETVKIKGKKWRVS
jgi:hypothetical protein